jgi:hypothetical protein
LAQFLVFSFCLWVHAISATVTYRSWWSLFVIILYSAACGHDIHFPSFPRHRPKENPSSLSCDFHTHYRYATEDTMGISISNTTASKPVRLPSVLGVAIAMATQIHVQFTPISTCTWRESDGLCSGKYKFYMAGKGIFHK